jgi:hypothetical protein
MAATARKQAAPPPSQSTSRPKINFDITDMTYEQYVQR